MLPESGDDVLEIAIPAAPLAVEALVGGDKGGVAQAVLRVEVSLEELPDSLDHVAGI